MPGKSEFVAIVIHGVGSDLRFSVAQAADTWVITDRVRAPTLAGEYVLRWRWDGALRGSHDPPLVKSTRRGHTW